MKKVFFLAELNCENYFEPNQLDELNNYILPNKSNAFFH